MQPRRRPHHGNLPAARPFGKGAQRRIAGRLSARHQLSHDVYRAGADAHSDSLPPRPLHDEGWAGLQLADAGAAASHQPDISRTDSVRACRRASAHPHHQPDVGRRRGGGGYLRQRRPARSRNRGGQAFELPLSHRLRRRALRCPQGDWRRVNRRRRRAARSVDLYPRPRSHRPSALRACPGAPAPSIPGAPAWCMRSMAASDGWCTIT
jgi:hypothetical protein